MMDAGKLGVEKRISMAKQKYFFKKKWI